MPKIVCDDTSTDRRIIDVLAGYVVCVDGVDIFVTGSGRKESEPNQGWLTLEGQAFIEATGEGDPDKPLSFVWDLIDEVVVY